MLFKMFGTEQSNAAQKPRQIFITQSRVLAERVQEYYLKLNQSLAGGRHTQKEFADTTQGTQAEKKLMKLYEDDDRLPKKFSELTDVHFPLFVTFDKVRSNSIYCSNT
jgi:hypothetical protein